MTSHPWWSHKAHTHLVDHVQRALKDGVKDLGDLGGDVASQLVDDGRHCAQHLGLAGRRDVSLVVYEHGLQQGGHKVLRHLRDHSEVLFFGGFVFFFPPV